MWWHTRRNQISSFGRNGRVHLNRRGYQFSRLLAAEVCASAVVMLDTPCSEVVWRVLATHSIRQFPLHFPSRASPCAITFQLDCTWKAHHQWTTENSHVGHCTYTSECRSAKFLLGGNNFTSSLAVRSMQHPSLLQDQFPGITIHSYFPQHVTPIFFRSFSTSANHLFFGSATDLFPHGIFLSTFSQFFLLAFFPLVLTAVIVLFQFLR